MNVRTGNWCESTSLDSPKSAMHNQALNSLLEASSSSSCSSSFSSSLRLNSRALERTKMLSLYKITSMLSLLM